MKGRFPILYIAEAEPEAAVLSSGVLAELVRTLPQASFTVVGSPTSAPLFADTPRLESLLVLERDARIDWIGLWNELRDTRWELIVDLRGSDISGRLRRVKRAVRGKDREGAHAVEAAADVLQLDETPAPRLHFSDATLAAANAVLGGDPAPLLAIGPGVDWIGKAWPPERFAKVASALLSADGPMAGGRLLIVGGPDLRETARTIRPAVSSGRLIEAYGRLTPLQTAAALARADLFIGCDSLWTQLAVAAGAPTLAVFGPSDEARTGPWKGVTVRGARSLAELRKLDPGLNQHIQHLMDLQPDRVLKAARRMLAARAVERV